MSVHSDYLPAAAILPFRSRLAVVTGIVVFYSLLVLLAFTAIPYGTAEAWWKAFFICVVFSLGVLWLIEGYLNNNWIVDGRTILLPIVALVLYSLFQTISFGTREIPGLPLPVSRTISIDPFETRFFALQVAAVGLFGLLLFRYMRTPRRLRIAINLVIAIVLVTAIFGIARRTIQHDTGFVLPLLHLEQGYGQFINQNHFAFLMEMGLGLTLGMILGGVVPKEQLLAYVAVLLPIWAALALCGSRAGLFAMMAQVLVAAFLFLSQLRQPTDDYDEQPRLLTLLQSKAMRLALILILSGGVLFGSFFLGGEHLVSRLSETRADFSSTLSDTNAKVSRNEIWRVTLKMFAAHPIFGVGMGAYWVGTPQFHNASGTLTPQEAHSDYLELLASGGLVGLAIGIWFFSAVVARIKLNLRSANSLRRAACFGSSISLAGVAVHSMVDFGLHVMVNAVVFATLIVIATSELPWDQKRIVES